MQVSLRLAGVTPGDEVIVPTLTFIAPVNAVSYNGATPVFMDADRYYNIDPEKTISSVKMLAKIGTPANPMPLAIGYTEERSLYL